MRARLVACEVHKTGKEDTCYASTPPGESKNMLFSWYASRRNNLLPDGSTVPLRLSFFGIKKAYSNGVPTREMFMSLPAELGLPKSVCGKTDQMRLWYKRRWDDLGTVLPRRNGKHWFCQRRVKPLPVLPARTRHIYCRTWRRLYSCGHRPGPRLVYY